MNEQTRERPPPQAQEPAFTVFVRGFTTHEGQQEAERALEVLFRDVAPDKIRVAVDRLSGQCKGFAHIDFKTEDGANQAVQTLNGTATANGELSVEMSNSWQSRQRGGGGGGGGGPASTKPREQWTSVFVRGLCADDGAPRIEEWLRAALEVTPARVRVGVDRSTGLAKNWAHVHFVKHADAMRAIDELSGMKTPSGTEVKAEMSIPRDQMRDRKMGGDARPPAPHGGSAPPQVGEAGDAPGAPPPPPAEPTFGLSGLLAQEANTTAKGVSLKYAEPADKAMPRRSFRLYVFKNGEMLKGNNGVLHLHRQSMYLFGRDTDAADIPTEHASCSKQHAVLQFRVREGSTEVRPYVIDLESTNGTRLNGDRIDSAMYIELKHKDMVSFGKSQREYVLIEEED
ncbi:smad nuclear-interacting protein 1 [Pseudoscourfieldia marina]